MRAFSDFRDDQHCSSSGPCLLTARHHHRIRSPISSLKYCTMATSRRNHHVKVMAWVFLVDSLLFFLPAVDSFSTTHIVTAKSKSQWQQRDRDGATSPLFAPLRGGRASVILATTATASSPTDSDETPSAATATEGPAADDEDETLDMPWSDVQEWALQDSLPKFTVTIVPSVAGGTPKRYAMWRTLTREVPELAGYPVPFLLKMHRRSSKRDGGTPGFLPMVDDFEFTPNGGVSGRAFGLPGIADGTRVQTPPLVAAETTVPLGYVTTCGSENEGVGFSYELGTCASSSSSSSAYSLDGTERSAALEAARRLVAEGAAADSTRQITKVAKDMAVSGSGLLTDNEANQDMVYLGGATAMLLASATAVGMLSHHLTVNVFWV